LRVAHAENRGADQMPLGAKAKTIKTAYITCLGQVLEREEIEWIPQ